MPVREYYRERQRWTIPTTDIPILRKRAQIHHIPLDISQPVIYSYNKHMEWRREQANILNGDVEVDPGNYPITGTLFPFQLIGAEVVYNACISVGGAYICDPVGLGKTVQSISVVERMMAERIVNFGFIICKSTLKRNWLAEFQQFTPGRSITIIEGDKPKRKKLYKQAYKHDYLVIGYEILMRDIDLIDDNILKRGFNFTQIVDEAQYIKTPEAQRTIATKAIAEHAHSKIGLSATPLETRLTDLFSGFQLIHDMVLGVNQSNFIQHYCTIDDYTGQIIGYQNTRELRSRLKPYLVRRFKEDVMDQLPQRIENNLWVDMLPEQAQLYKDMKRNIADAIEDMEKKQKIQMASILPMITYLRQVCLSTKIVGHPENISAKTGELMEMLETIDQRSKVVVFCHYTGMIELLHETLNSAGIKHTAMHGGGGTVGKTALAVPVEKRIDTINAWQADPHSRVLLTSDILSEGVNIPSASYIINFDILFNPAKMEQRVGRLDRLSQKHSHINIINILTNGTLEEDLMYQRLKERRNMTTEIMDGGRVESRMSFNDIRSIIGIK
jgi:SNF2 family DNA or RNA helicase